MKRFSALYVVPTLLLLAYAAAPLISGDRTLYLRDVLSSHYSLKASQALSLKQGEIASIDLYRAGGQPLLGNPNVLPLYPDNLLYLFAHPLWALNAHFWLHLLLAPLAVFWLGRAWGLSRRASWAAGVLYAGSGFLLSLFNLYNLIAGAVLAPALTAACLRARAGSRRAAAIAGGLWALLLLAGDPLFAALGLMMSLSAAFLTKPPPAANAPPTKTLLRRSVLALGCGTAVASPMLIEFLRILPLSFRGHWNYSLDMTLLHSWNPRTLIEWFLPLFFGRPDFDYWGFAYHDGVPPLFYSLFPGILALLLALIAGRGGEHRHAALWAWALTLGGVFLALGSHNPIMVALYGLPGMGLLRFPVKVWLIVAVGLALLGGVGFERLEERRRRFSIALTATVGLFLLSWIGFNTGFAESLRALDPRFAGPFFEPERLRWAGLCLLQLFLLGFFAASWRVHRRSAAFGGALLLFFHLASQLFFLRPLYDSDEIEPYVARPELLDAVPEDALVVHGGFHDLFGAPRLDPNRGDEAVFPDRRTNWLSRRHFAQLYPFSGIAWGRRYAFNNSPEGLDSFFSISLGRAMKALPDSARVRILTASGVDFLLLDRELEPAAQSLVDLRARRPDAGYDLFLYELRNARTTAILAGTVLYAPQMNAALQTLGGPQFDPRTTVVLPGEGDSRAGPPGNVEIRAETTHEMVFDVDSAEGGVLVVQRAFLDLYRATVDDEEALVQAADLHRLGVEVPAGAHEVRIWVDRRPNAVSWMIAFCGLLGLMILVRSDE